MSETDALRHECGVVGVHGVPDAASYTAVGLSVLQNRGRDAVGIVSLDGYRFYSERHLGLVSQNFSEQNLSQLHGRHAIGHNLNALSPSLRNIQPLYNDLENGGFAIAMNGSITNAQYIRKRMVRRGTIFQSISDVEVIVHLVSLSDRVTTEERIIDALSQIEGGFSVVALSEGKMFAARDSSGIRPLIVGKLSQGYVVASESSAIDSLGGEVIRDVGNGELLVFEERKQFSSHAFGPTLPHRPCALEYISFANPSSVISGVSVSASRLSAGQLLAQESPCKADIVVPIQTAEHAATAYAEALGIPLRFAVKRIENRLRFLTNLRDRGAAGNTHAIDKSMVSNKRVVLIEDAILRGNTTQARVSELRAAGATEVHVRVASPPIQFQDAYGIDMPSEVDLMAARHGIEEMTNIIGADSLAFLSASGLHRAITNGEPRGETPLIADHYFTGDYPTRLIDRDLAGQAQTNQLSFLDDSSQHQLHDDLLIEEFEQVDGGDGYLLQTRSKLPQMSAFFSKSKSDKNNVSVMWPWRQSEATAVSTFQDICSSEAGWTRVVNFFLENKRLEEIDQRTEMYEPGGLIPNSIPGNWKSNACSVSMDLFLNTRAQSNQFKTSDPLRRADFSVWYSTEKSGLQSLEAGISANRALFKKYRGSLVNLVTNSHEDTESSPLVAQTFDKLIAASHLIQSSTRNPFSDATTKHL